MRNELDNKMLSDMKKMQKATWLYKLNHIISMGVASILFTHLSGGLREIIPVYLILFLVLSTLMLHYLCNLRVYNAISLTSIINILIFMICGLMYEVNDVNFQFFLMIIYFVTFIKYLSYSTTKLDIVLYILETKKDEE